ncbi:hypothetical protein Tco_1411490 [Tanacetum coccineum]
MPQEDEVFPAKEQPLPAATSPTCQSPDYVPESDPKEDLEEDDDEDPEEDPADYPEVDIEADDEEEKEHPTPTDSTAIALPAADQARSAEETKPFETDESAATPPPHPTYRVTSRISIPAPVPTPVWSDSEVARLLAISTPPSSPLSPWLSPLPQIPSPPLPLILPPPLLQIPSPPLPVSSPVSMLSLSPPASPIRSLGYRAAIIWLRVEAASTSHSLPLPTPIILSHTRPDTPLSGTPPLHLLSTDHREDRPKVTLPPQKRLGIALGPRYEIGESLSIVAVRLAGGLKADYGFVATMDREIRRDLERDVGYGINLLASRLNMLFRDRCAHARTARLMETKARMSREAWGRSMDASDLACVEVMSLRTTVSQKAEVVHKGTKADKETSDSDGRELALLCGRMFLEESDKIKKYVGGLPDMIHGSVEPKIMQEVTKMAIEVKDKRIRTFANRQTESKRKFEDTSRNTQNQQQHQNKRLNTRRAYAAGAAEKKQYGGSKPLCLKCNYHHDGPCAPK